MPQTFLTVLKGWHDFYALVGTASATLVGLMFVAASIGAGVFTRDQNAGMRAFITPTVVHFTAVLVTCLIAIIPTETRLSLSGLLACAGFAGIGYSVWIWRSMVRHGFAATIDAVDRLWYALLPLAGYVLVAVSGIGLEFGVDAGLDILAVALIVLLLAGIRNAWDMTVWILQRRQS